MLPRVLFDVAYKPLRNGSYKRTHDLMRYFSKSTSTFTLQPCLAYNHRHESPLRTIPKVSPIKTIRLTSTSSSLSAAGGRIFPIGPTIKRRTLEVKTTELPEKFNMEWPKITLFGDSITRRSYDPDNGCWTSHVAHRVAHYFQVDVRGFDGYNSAWGLELMPKLFPRSYLDKVEIFVPFFGHNDAWDEMWKPVHVPVVDYERNMRQIIKYLQENGVDSSKIILITPTWYDKSSFDAVADRRLPLLSKKYEDQVKYSDAIIRIAKDNNIEVLDFFTISSKYEPFAKMFCDGCHLSNEGARLLYNSIIPIIEKKIKAKFEKPLEDLWHVVPVDQHPEVKPVLEKKQKELREKSSC